MRIVLWLLLLISALSFFVQAEEADPAQWVQKLSSDDFDTRTAAEVELIRLGEVARPALQRARESQDHAFASSAERILARLSRASLQIMAFDPDGKPVPRAEGVLTMTPQDGKPVAMMIKLDDSGKTLIPTAPVGRTSIQWALISRDPVNTIQRLEFQPGENVFPIFSTRTGVIKGRVECAEGVVQGNVFVTLSPDLVTPHHTSKGRLVAPTDEATKANIEPDGTFEFRDVPPGVFHVCLSGACEPVFGPVIRVRPGKTMELPLFQAKPQEYGTVSLRLRGGDDTWLSGRSFFCELRRYPDPSASAGFSGPVFNSCDRGRYESFKLGRFGKLNLKDIGPGKYTLCLWPDLQSETWREVPPEGEMDAECRALAEKYNRDNLRFEIREFEVLPGKQTNLGTLTPTETGAVGGHINKDGAVPGADPVPAQKVDVVLVAEEIARIPRMWEGIQEDLTDAGYPGVYVTETDEDGNWIIKHAKPGRYICISEDPSGHKCYQYGVVCQAGKSTDVRMPKAKPAAEYAARPDIPFSAIVVNAQGEAVAGVSLDGPAIFAVSRSSDAGEIRASIADEGERLVTVYVSAPGYHTTAAQYDTQTKKPVAVTLTPVQYGRLKLKVVSGSGEPVEGASVDIAAGASSSSAASKTTTDSRGEVTIDSLVTGERFINVSCDGWMTERVKVDVRADASPLTTVPLKRGASVRCHLDRPPGVAAPLLLNFDSENRSLAVPNAEATITGLLQLEQRLSLNGPAILIEPREFKLKLDQKGAIDLNMKLARACASVVEVEPSLKLKTLSLVPLAEWSKHETLLKTGAFDITFPTKVDGNGRAEWHNIPPGDYAVAHHVQEGDDAWHLLTRLHVDTPWPHDEMEKFPAVKAAMPKTGTMRMVTTCAALRKLQREHSRFDYTANVVIMGDNGVVYSSPQLLSGADDFPRTINLVPIGLEPARPFERVFRNLPEGTYTIYCQGLWSVNPDQKPCEPEKIRAGETFTLRAGDDMSLRVNVPRPEHMPEAGWGTARQPSPASQDRNATFRP